MNNGAKNRKAIFYVLVAVLLYSLLPLLFFKGDAKSSPFFFTSILKLSSAGACLIFLMFRYSEALFSKTVWRVVVSHIRSWAIWIAIIANIDYAIFAWSLRYVDLAVATILYETWPLFAIIATSWLFKKQNRYRKQTTEIWVLICFAFLGLALVVLSQSQDLSGLLKFKLDDLKIEIIILILFAAVLGGLPVACNLKWANDLMKNEKSEGSKVDIPEGFLIVIAVFITQSAGCLIAGVIGFSSGETVENIQSGVFYAIACGLLLNGGGTLLLRQANRITDNLSINALSYATPVIALGWLWYFDIIDIPNVSFLLIGTAAIISSNLLLNFRAEIKVGYKSLIIGLWMCGVIIYIFKGAVFQSYFELITVSITMFTLLLVFRTDRLRRLIVAESVQAIKLHYQVINLENKKVFSPATMFDCCAITTHLCSTDSPANLSRMYEKFKVIILEAKFEIKGSGKNEEQNMGHLIELEQELDMLFFSKQQLDNFGELVALFIIGSISLSTLLFSDPYKLMTWQGVMIDMAAFLLATGVIFLFFNTIDMQRERRGDVFVENSGSSCQTHHQSIKTGFQINFTDSNNRSLERIVSILVCVYIISTYGLLFWDKWVLKNVYF